jgi:N-acetylglucosaminyldiphosphoundecaprenol N-acetyl-beta-D-mannosaminyltransferase
MATFNLKTSSVPTVGLFDYSILNGGLDKIKFNSQCLINTINQYSYIAAQKDSDFKKALMESDVLLPDGIGIVAAIKMLNGENVKKIAGADLHHYMLKRLDSNGGTCFYLGSKDSTLQAIKTRLNKEYPNIKVGVYSPPFKAHFTEQENAEMISAVNAFKPDVLFVGMTAPKQEKWSYLHKDQLKAKIICPIGAVFDFYAETISRPSQFWINIGMEWFIRLIREPKRMSKRYLYYGPVFVYDLLRMKFSRSLTKPVVLEESSYRKVRSPRRKIS